MNLDWPVGIHRISVGSAFCHRILWKRPFFNRILSETPRSTEILWRNAALHRNSVEKRCLPQKFCGKRESAISEKFNGKRVKMHPELRGKREKLYVELRGNRTKTDWKNAVVPAKPGWEIRGKPTKLSLPQKHRGREADGCVLLSNVGRPPPPVTPNP